jgi:hypothetical protein
MSLSSIPVARIRVAIALCIILAPMVVRTTPPEPAPYHQFNVTGNIIRTGGGPLQNYTVGVAEKRVDGWRLINEGPRPLDITGDQGKFGMYANSYDPVDSLAVALLLPGEDLFIAVSFRRDSVEPSEAREYYTPYRESDGCCDDTTDPMPPAVRVIGYIYDYPEMTVQIP